MPDQGIPATAPLSEIVREIAETTTSLLGLVRIRVGTATLAAPHDCTPEEKE